MNRYYKEATPVGLNKLSILPSPANPNPYGWLKTSDYTITDTLHQWVNDNKSIITQEDITCLCYIQHMVLCARNWQVDNEGYARLSKTIWRDKCGQGYKKYVDMLTGIGEVEVDNAYSNDPAYKLCKGFKVPCVRIAGGLVRYSIKLKQVNPMKPQSFFWRYDVGGGS